MPKHKLFVILFIIHDTEYVRMPQNMYTVHLKPLLKLSSAHVCVCVLICDIDNVLFIRIFNIHIFQLIFKNILHASGHAMHMSMPDPVLFL